VFLDYKALIDFVKHRFSSHQNNYDMLLLTLQNIESILAEINNESYNHTVSLQTKFFMNPSFYAASEMQKNLYAIDR